MKKFYSIEYIDDEGEKNVKHAILDSDGAIKCIEEFAARGVLATMYEISANQFIDDEVNSTDKLFV